MTKRTCQQSTSDPVVSRTFTGSTHHLARPRSASLRRDEAQPTVALKTIDIVGVLRDRRALRQSWRQIRTIARQGRADGCMVGLDPPHGSLASPGRCGGAGGREMNRVGAGRIADEVRLVQAVLAIACPRCGAGVDRQCAGDQRVPVFCAVRVVEAKRASFSGVDP